jgi:DNA-binding response OmpR family regulator
MRILAVEDHSRFAPAVLSALSAEGFAVDLAPDLADGEHLLSMTGYDLVLLDFRAPAGEALAFLQRTRRIHPSLPMIVLSPAAAVGDRVIGLTAGADDYLVKPFATEELIARMRAALRRPAHALGRELHFDGLMFNTLDSSVQVDARPLTIPRRELAILETLMRANGRVVSKPALEASAYAIDDTCGSNVLEANVSRLRRRIRAAGADVDIKVVRGVGYRLDSARPRAAPPDQARCACAMRYCR